MKITIKEPFETAWKMFNWSEKTWGVGLNKQIVDTACEKNLTLEVDLVRNNTKYVIPAKSVAKYGNPYEIKNVKLYVVPEYYLRKLI